MASGAIGEVGLHIFPDFSGAEKSINSQLKSVGGKVGGTVSKNFNKSFNTGTKGIGKSLNMGLASSAGSFVKTGLSIGAKISGSIASTMVGAVKTTGKVAGYGLAGSLAGAGAVAGVSFSKGLSRTLDIEDARKKLEGMKYGQGAINNIMDDALKSVKGTAFGLQEAATASASAVASGIKPGGQLLAYLKSIGDAATQGGVEFNSMAGIFNKVIATGKAQGDTFQQLAENGIPAVQMLAKEFNLTTSEVYELGSKGQISSNMFMKAMQQISGAALKSGETTRGAFKNLGAALGRLGEKTIAGIFPFGKVFASEATIAADSLTNSLEPVFNSISKKYTPVLEKFFDGSGNRFAAFVTKVAPLFEKFADQIGRSFRFIADGWRSVNQDFAQNGLNGEKIFGGVLDGLGKTIALIGKLIGAMSPIGTVFAVVLGKAFNGSAGKKVYGFVDGLIGQFSLFMNTVRDFFLITLPKAMKPFFGKVAAGFSSVFNGVKQVFGAIGRNGASGGDVFTGIVSALGSGIQLIGKFIGSLAPLGAALAGLLTRAFSGNAGSTLYSFLDSAISKFGGFVKQVSDFLVIAIPPLVEFGKEFFGTLWEGVKGLLPSFKGISGAGLAKAFTGALPAIKSFGKSVGGLIKDAAPFIRMFAEEAWKGIKATFSFLGDAFKQALPYLQDFAKWLGENSETLRKFIGPIAGIAGVVALFKVGMKTMGSSSQAAAGQVGYSANAFDNAIQKMFYITSTISNRQAVFDFFKLGGGAKKSAGEIASVGNAAKSSQGKIKGFVSAGLKGAFSGLGAIISTAATGMTRFGTALVAAAGGALTKVAAGIRIATAATWRFTAALLANPITWVVIGVVALIGVIALLVLNWDKVTNAAKTAWGAVSNFATTSWNKIAGWGSSVGQTVGGWFSSAKSALSGTFTSIANQYKGILTTLGGFFGKISGGVLNAFKSAKTGMSNVFNSIGQMAQNGLDGLFNSFDALRQGLRSTFKGVGNFIIYIVNIAINGINNLFSALNSMKITVPNWVPGAGGKSWGFNLPPIQSIPTLDTGGDTTKPTIAMLSKNGVAETVTNRGRTNEMIERTNKMLKKESNSSASAGPVVYGGITINASNAVSADEIYQKFAKRLEQLT